MDLAPDVVSEKMLEEEGEIVHRCFYILFACMFEIMRQKTR